MKISIKDNKQKLELLQAEFLIELQVEILKAYKGELKRDTITLYTSRTGASCGFTRFEEGLDFIIYASSKSHVFRFFNSENDLEKENTL